VPTYESSTISAGSPDAAWSVWTDVAGWDRFDHIESASITGAFEHGATIKSKAKGLPASTLALTRVDRPRLWVDESGFPGLRMRFEHVIESTPSGTRLTERVLITGPLGRVVGPLMRRKLEQLFADSVAAVAHAAEPTRAPG
jgi:hypothetical protein